MERKDDLVAYAEQRVQDIAAASAVFREQGLIARADVLAAGVEPGSAEDVAAIIFEHSALMSDANVVRYENPSEEQLLDVLALAEVYEGDWYHSHVHLTSDFGWTPLQQRIVDLPPSAGVSRSYTYAECEGFELP